MTLDDLYNYMDPFNNECRVYGRLKETNKEHLAIECHGYLIFTPEYLRTKGIETKLDRKEAEKKNSLISYGYSVEDENSVQGNS
jgi:hypothetical protein